MQRFLLFLVLFLVVSCGGQTKEELLREGNTYRDDGNFRGAIVLYRNALEKDVNYLDARYELADAYLNTGNYGRAEKEFNKVLLQNPSRVDINLKLASIFIQNKQPEQALLTLDKYHIDNGESAESLVLYGRANGATGNLVLAQQFFSKALLLDSNSIPARFNLAKVFLQKKEPASAKTYLQEVIDLDSKKIEAYYLLASIENSNGEREAALAIYQQLVKIDAKQIQAYYMAGILQMDLGDTAGVAKTVDTLLTSFPNRSEGSRLNGLMLYRQGKYSEAKIALDKSISVQPHLLSYFFLGLSYYGMDQYELALNQFQKSLDINPSFERARVLVAMTLLKQKRIDDAIISIKKVLRVNPNNGYAHNILGSAYLASGQYDAGMEELEIAIDIDPNIADAHLKLGMFHLSQGQGAKGESELVKAVASSPKVMNNRLMLVTHYLNQKNYSAAIDSIKAGLNGSKTDALLNNYLAAAYFAQKKPDLALAALNQAKAVNPEYLTPYYNIASYYASQSEYEKSIAEYQRILAFDNQNLRALVSIAALYNVMGKEVEQKATYAQIEATETEKGYLVTTQYQLKQADIDAAFATIDRGLSAFGSSIPLLEIKGKLHLRQQQIGEAEKTFIKLKSISPGRGNVLLARLYFQNKQTDKAEQIIADALRDDADKEYPYLLSSGLLRSENNVEKSIEVLQQGIATVSNPLRLQMQLASVYQQSGKTDSAKLLYIEIITKAPRFAPAYTALGFIDEINGSKGDARDNYRKAIKLDKGNVQALNNLAYLLVDNFGQAEEALNYAMSALRLRPNDPRIMDTLGYVLVKNGKANDAINLLTKANELLPENKDIKAHLNMAKKMAK